MKPFTRNCLAGKLLSSLVSDIISTSMFPWISLTKAWNLFLIELILTWAIISHWALFERRYLSLSKKQQKKTKKKTTTKKQWLNLKMVRLEKKLNQYNVVLLEYFLNNYWNIHSVHSVMLCYVTNMLFAAYSNF